MNHNVYFYCRDRKIIMSISTVVNVTYLPSALDSNSRIPSLRQDLLVIHTHNARTRLWLAVRVKSPHSTYTLSRGSCKGGREHGNHGFSQELALAVALVTSLRPGTCYLLLALGTFHPVGSQTDRQTIEKEEKRKENICMQSTP